jgi:hypothetical protein
MSRTLPRTKSLRGNQFKGLLRLWVYRAERLCLPSRKSLDPTKVAAPVRGFEHFEWYAATLIVRLGRWRQSGCGISSCRVAAPP